MTDNWDRILFEKDLKSILESKLPVSASKITALQALATAHPMHHNYIIQCITRFIETAPPDYRLAGLYVIDAISRVVHKQLRKRVEANEEGHFEAEGYLKRFAIVLKEDSLQGCFEPCSVKDKDKVKKTLDFWEQGNIYPKEVVQYVKGSFLKQKLPPVDTASLLATLSNISNLNIPGLAPPAPPQQQENNDKTLPPALAKLLGGIVTNSPTPSAPAPQVRADPRMQSAKDPRQKPMDVWPPPPPPPPSGGSVRPDRKSRWGHDVDNNNKNNVTEHSPTTPQDPWFNRQAMTQYQAFPQANNQSYYQQPYQPSYQPSFGQAPNSQFSQASPSQLTQASSQFAQAPPSQFQRNPQPFQRNAPSQFDRNSQRSSQFERNSPINYDLGASQHTQPMFQQNSQPLPDSTLAPGFIRVLTRTLFVGPIPDHYEKEDVARLFARYGEIASVIVSKKLKGRHNAFLKYTTRGATEAAKYNGAGLIVEGVPVKVNWGFGFGPKKHFDYNRGDSVIPLSELSAEEKDNLVIARIGGFQGQPVRDGMIIEEPEAQYKPEWKDNERNGGMKRGNHLMDENNNRKRTRM